MPQTRLGLLLDVAIGDYYKEPVGPKGYTTASNGRWQAWATNRYGPAAIVVQHHKTPLFAYVFEGSRKGEVIPLDPGWGSRTDKQGTNLILKGAHLPYTYESLFGRYGKINKTVRIPPYLIETTPEPVHVERFHPPISVGDTIV